MKGALLGWLACAVGLGSAITGAVTTSGDARAWAVCAALWTLATAIWIFAWAMQRRMS